MSGSVLVGMPHDTAPRSKSARLARMYELLTLERRDDGVAVVTLRNGKVNALSGALLGELEAVGRASCRPTSPVPS